MLGSAASVADGGGGNQVINVKIIKGVYSYFVKVILLATDCQ